MGTKEHGPWPLPPCLPADQDQRWHPPLRPRDLHPRGSVRAGGGGGRIWNFSQGQRNCAHSPCPRATQPLPAGLEPAGHFVWLRLRWAPARLPTAVSPPRPLRGTESGRWRDRSRSEVLVQDSPALGTSPNPITGPGWHQGRPPTPDGPRPGTGWLQRTEPTRTAVCPAHPLGLPRLTPRSAHVL